jgi:hypothetical protein
MLLLADLISKRLAALQTSIDDHEFPLRLFENFRNRVQGISTALNICNIKKLR